MAGSLVKAIQLARPPIAWITARGRRTRHGVASDLCKITRNRIDYESRNHNSVSRAIADAKDKSRATGNSAGGLWIRRGSHVSPECVFLENSTSYRAKIPNVWFVSNGSQALRELTIKTLFSCPEEINV